MLPLKAPVPTREVPGAPCLETPGGKFYLSGIKLFDQMPKKDFFFVQKHCSKPFLV